MGLYATVTFEGNMLLQDGKLTTIKADSKFQTKDLGGYGNFSINKSGKLIAIATKWRTELPETMFYTARIYDEESEYNLLFYDHELINIENLKGCSDE